MSLEQDFAKAMRDRIDARLRETLVGHIAPSPPRPSVLTLDMLGEVYDQLWDIPPEPHWYLCHPDDLAWVRALVGRDAPGKHTCPIVRAHKVCEVGKMVRLAVDHDESWMWRWQRRKEAS